MYPDSCGVPGTVLVARLTVLVPTLVVSVSTAPAAEMNVERRQQCERRGISRVVELRETPEGGLPCEVIYLKPDEDRSEIALWSARTDRGFCRTRFEAFVVKLESTLDWQCEAVDETSATAAPEASIDTTEVPSAARSVVPTKAEREAATIASRLMPPDRVVELAPDLGAAVPILSEAHAPDGTDSEMLTSFGRLQSLVPSGTYVAVPVLSNEWESDVRVPSWCPPGGTFSWKAEYSDQPVFALGETIEIAVRLADTMPDGRPVLSVVSSAGEGVARELQTLSPTPAEQGSQAIDIRVVPRGPGSGALSPGICRYVLEE